MHTTDLRKVGGSVMLAVPPAILDLLNLEAGSTVGLAVNGERLVIQPQPKPRYTLDELSTQCEPSAAITEEDRNWLDSSCRPGAVKCGDIYLVALDPYQGHEEQGTRPVLIVLRTDSTRSPRFLSSCR